MWRQRNYRNQLKQQVRFHGSDYVKIIYQPDVYVAKKGGHWITVEFQWEVHDHWAKGVWSVIIGLLGLATEVFFQTLDSWLCPAGRCCFETKTHTVQTIWCAVLSQISFFFHLTKEKKGEPQVLRINWGWRSGTTKRRKGWCWRMD